MTIFETDSAEKTGEIAGQLAARSKAGSLYFLNGPLGAGKSVFARGFIRALCGPATEVPSPTFTLVQTYDSAKGAIWHFDLYRLKEPEEIFDLGWDDAVAGGIVLVEWAERLGPYAPRSAKTIVIEPTGEHSRRIEIYE